MTLELPSVRTLRARGSVKWSAFPDALGAFVAEMDFGLAPPVAAALQEVLADARTGYVPEPASAALTEATAAWCADRYDWRIDPAQVRPIGDVLTALDVTLRRYSDPTRPVIVPTPAYMPFLRVPEATGRPVIEVPSPVVDGRTELDLEGIDAAFRAGADVLVLCNPWNPVGTVLTREELAAVGRIVDRHGGRVFADEIHAPIVFDGRRHVPYASVDEVTASHAITAISASKAFNLPGLKCAQVILTNEADAAAWERSAGFAAHGAGLPGVLAGTAAYTAGGPWLDEALAHIDGSRRLLADRLAAELPAVACTPPEGTYIAWLDVRALDLGDRPAEAVRERAGVALTDGADCGAPGFLRFVLATPRPVVEEVLDRLVAAFG